MTERARRPLRVLLDSQVDRRFQREVDIDLLRRVVERALGAEGLSGDVEISLVVTDDAKQRRLNAAYRGKDSTTDVLSFPLLSPDELVGDESNFVAPPDDVLRLGDIILSFPRAKEQAAEYGHSLSRELAYLAVHGVLHLLGYDHEEEAERGVMRAKEEAALRDEPGAARAGA